MGKAASPGVSDTAEHAMFAGGRQASSKALFHST